MAGFRFGVVKAQARSSTEWKHTAARIEAAGFSTLLLPDTPGPVLAPFSALATAAACTTTLRVGNWVLANDFRSPVLVAREAATLQVLSDGRFELGLGAGRGDNDYASLGLSPGGSGGQRLARLAESVQIIKAFFRGEAVSFEGEFYSVRNARLYPPPAREVPILMAASGPRALGLAARYADSVAIGSNTRELFAQQVDDLRQAAGDRFAQIELASLVFVVPESDRAVAQAEIALARRLGGRDLQAMIASNAPMVVHGSVDAMCEQLIERRASFGLSYIVVGEQVAQAFAPVVQRLAGT